MTLAGDSVHVWRAFLNEEEEQAPRLLRLLSGDEKARAERFFFQKDRIRFIVARAVFRRIMGRYLGVAPEGLRFSYSIYGKPSLLGASGGGGFRFNMTRSQGLALYAFALVRDVGIDVECVRAELAGSGVAAAFSDSEAEMLNSLPEDQRAEAFFTCWTRKEAYVKAMGKGLSIPLDAFDVSPLPGQPARLMKVRGDPMEASRWSLMDIHPGQGYIGALAVEGDATTPLFWQWSSKDDGP